MDIYQCSKEDFDQILDDLADFWKSERTRHLHIPILIYEFGNSAFVIKEGDKVIAYLFGMLSQTESAAYVHLVAVRRTYQGRGLGRELYSHFIEYAQKHGCNEIKVITKPVNKSSIAFHQQIGMQTVGSSESNKVPVITDYGGPGEDRVVFRMKI